MDGGGEEREKRERISVILVYPGGNRRGDKIKELKERAEVNRPNKQTSPTVALI